MTKYGFLFLCLLPLLGGCGSGSTADLEHWMNDADKGMAGQIDPIPIAQPYQPFVFDAFDLRDPFDPQKLLAAKRQNSANAPDFNRPRETLENYDLDKLKMVGLLKRGAVTYALISTPENIVYRVQPGNFVGPNFGQVKHISEAGLELAETVEDLNGDWVQRTTTMYLVEQGQK